MICKGGEVGRSRLKGRGLVFRVLGLKFKGRGLGFGVQGLGFWV